MRRSSIKVEKLREKYHLAFEGSIEESEYFFFETSPHHNLPIAIVFGGYEKCAPDFEISRKSYPYYVIEYPLKGKCELEINSETYSLKPGYLAGFSPSCSHHYRCDPDKPMEHIFIAFTGLDAAELFTKCTLNRGAAVFLQRREQVSFLVRSILDRALEKSEYSRQLCCSLLRALLLEVAHNCALPGQSGTISKETYRKCRRYIDENFPDIPSPGYVADTCNVNVRYMAKLFRQYSDITPQQYIMRLKMNKAAGLLLTTNLTVGKVAEMTGFNDQYHFSRNFKKFHGKSPRKYRKMFTFA